MEDMAMREVSKVFNEGWFNCFVSFVKVGTPSNLCQEVLIGAGISDDEVYEFMECGECTSQVRNELENYLDRMGGIIGDDEDDEDE